MIQPSPGDGTMSWLWIMWIPSSRLSPLTYVWVGLARRATYPGPQGAMPGVAMGWETTSVPSALMAFTSGRVRLKCNIFFIAVMKE